MAGRGRILATASGAGVAVGVAGASVTAASAATVIVATGGAVALVFIGYGAYRWLTSDAGNKDLEPKDERSEPGSSGVRRSK